jgi:hypothetical protein
MGRFPVLPRGADAKMVGKKKALKRGRKSPVGDRWQFLTMMSPDVNKASK